MARTTLVLFSILALYIQQGLGLQCFVCSSDVDSHCSDPFNATRHRYLLDDCERGKSHSSFLSPKSYCRKYKHYVAGELITVRSCIWLNDNEAGPCSPASMNPTTKLESCSYCDEEQCNGASSLIATLLVFPITLLASRFL